MQENSISTGAQKTLSTTIPENIKMKISELQDTILTAHPRLPMLLREIKQILVADPDCVTLLDEESVGVIVSGLKKQTATEISVAALKKGSGKSLKATTVDDL